MQAELKLKKKGTEEQFEELFTEEVQIVKEIERTIMLQIQKDLEVMLIAELLEKLQPKQLEKTVLEEETQKQAQEDEGAEEQFLEYGLEVETAYSKDKRAYQAQQPYEQDHGNRTGYESKQ